MIFIGGHSGGNCTPYSIYNNTTCGGWRVARRINSMGQDYGCIQDCTRRGLNELHRNCCTISLCVIIKMIALDLIHRWRNIQTNFIRNSISDLINSVPKSPLIFAFDLSRSLFLVSDKPPLQDTVPVWSETVMQIRSGRLFVMKCICASLYCICAGGGFGVDYKVGRKVSFVPDIFDRAEIRLVYNYRSGRRLTGLMQYTKHSQMFYI